MNAKIKWAELGWEHEVWELLRFYRSIRGSKNKDTWLEQLEKAKELQVGEEDPLPISSESIDLLLNYIDEQNELLSEAFKHLRTEKQAKEFCRKIGSKVKVTATQSRDHHQSSKALIAAVSMIAEKVASSKNITINTDPQKRCVWCNSKGLHVTARNLDGVIPSLTNPKIVWEIKEYWGKTKGGSKMSDAVYECHLVGRELLDFKKKTELEIEHIVFIDGYEQWNHRQSDFMRFIDLTQQGIIDYLFIGKDVENKWEEWLSKQF